jgi:NTP pyrophosphatase (non-canonical NTP hydrolase)
MKITTFNEYQKEVISLKISLNKFLELHPDLPEDIKLLLAVAYDGLGLGETGEVQDKIKKIIRDSGGIITEEAKKGILFEIGDCLWYLTSLCETLGTTLEDVANQNIIKLKSRREKNTLHGSGDNR